MLAVTDRNACFGHVDTDGTWIGRLEEVGTGEVVLDHWPKATRRVNQSACWLSFYFSLGRATGYSADHPERPAGLKADHTIDLRTPVYASITDFLELSKDHGQPADKLHRYDLAILRLHVRIMPRTLEYPGDHLPMIQASIARLLAAEMLDEYWEGAPATYITDDGRQIVRSNSSCIDGTENLPTAPGRVRDFWQQPFPPQTKLLRAAPVRRPPTKAEYDSVLAIAMSDTLPPPATNHAPRADGREVQAGRVGVRAAVWAWVQRQMAFGRLCLAVAIGRKHLGGHE